MGKLLSRLNIREKYRSATGKNDVSIENPGHSNTKQLRASDTPSRAHTTLSKKKKDSLGEAPYRGTKNRLA